MKSYHGCTANASLSSYHQDEHLSANTMDISYDQNTYLSLDLVHFTLGESDQSVKLVKNMSKIIFLEQLSCFYSH